MLSCLIVLSHTALTTKNSPIEPSTKAGGGIRWNSIWVSFHRRAILDHSYLQDKKDKKCSPCCFSKPNVSLQSKMFIFHSKAKHFVSKQNTTLRFKKFPQPPAVILRIATKSGPGRNSANVRIVPNQGREQLSHAVTVNSSQKVLPKTIRKFVMCRWSRVNKSFISHLHSKLGPYACKMRGAQHFSWGRRDLSEVI